VQQDIIIPVYSKESSGRQPQDESVDESFISPIVIALAIKAKSKKNKGDETLKGFQREEFRCFWTRSNSRR